MSNTYAKLFSAILDSSVWRESKETRLVWITMLAMKDRDGVVNAAVPGLADRAKVSLQECVAALKTLSSPDEWSRSKDYEGRRIEAVPGGWRVLNHEVYRNKMGLDERREYQRQKQAEYRKRKKEVKASGKSAGATQAIKEGLEASEEVDADFRL